jgi:hypothetical protein
MMFLSRLILKNYFAVFLAIVLFAGCKSSKTLPRPGWLQNRPINSFYYTGIGSASKSANALDYHQVAKKNALEDLVSEIKVTVSANSVLKHTQSNMDFSQQFISTTRTTALNTIENYETVGTWEDKEQYWIYFRLSKDEYQTSLRKKMQGAIDRAEELLGRAQAMNLSTDFVASMRLKVMALASLQQYLNEDIGLVNTIFSSLLDQLKQIQIEPEQQNYKSQSGAAVLPTPKARVRLKNGLPLIRTPFIITNDLSVSDKSLSSANGEILFANARVPATGSTQFLKIKPDYNRLIQADSLSSLMQNILSTIDPPGILISVSTTSAKIFIETSEKNLDKPVKQSIIAPAISNGLMQMGCQIVGSKNDADFILSVDANTISKGPIWGDMKTASLSISVSVTNKEQIQIGKEFFTDINGYQNTDEQAGNEAYKKGREAADKKIIPFLRKTIFGN